LATGLKIADEREGPPAEGRGMSLHLDTIFVLAFAAAVATLVVDVASNFWGDLR
jgi:hypothetical protein